MKFRFLFQKNNNKKYIKATSNAIKGNIINEVTIDTIKLVVKSYLKFAYIKKEFKTIVNNVAKLIMFNYTKRLLKCQ